jgi:hypothetical protein
MAFRWSKTLSAYNQWAFIFEKELPFEIEVDQSSLTISAYLRDIISYANENQLKGADWYKKVTVTPINENTIGIRMKRNQAQVNTYPSKSIFEVMEMAQNGEMRVGYKFISVAPLDELEELLDSLDVHYRDLKNNLVEIM